MAGTSLARVEMSSSASDFPYEGRVALYFYEQGLTTKYSAMMMRGLWEEFDHVCKANVESWITAWFIHGGKAKRTTEFKGMKLAGYLRATAGLSSAEASSRNEKSDVSVKKSKTPRRRRTSGVEVANKSTPQTGATDTPDVSHATDMLSGISTLQKLHTDGELTVSPTGTPGSTAPKRRASTTEEPSLEGARASKRTSHAGIRPDLDMSATHQPTTMPGMPNSQADTSVRGGGISANHRPSLPQGMPDDTYVHGLDTSADHGPLLPTSVFGIGSNGKNTNANSSPALQPDAAPALQTDHYDLFLLDSPDWSFWKEASP